MPLAINTALLLALVLPGLAFVFIFHLAIGARTAILKSISSQISFALLVSLALHGGYWAFFEPLLIRLPWVQSFNFEYFYALVSGGGEGVAQKALMFEAALNNISENRLRIFTYWILAVAAGAFLGFLLARFFVLRRNRAWIERVTRDPWLYFNISARRRGANYLSVMVHPLDSDNRPLLYAGLGYDVVPKDDGGIKHLTLLLPERRNIKSGNGEAYKFTKPVPLLEGQNTPSGGDDPELFINGDSILNVFAEWRTKIETYPFKSAKQIIMIDEFVANSMTSLNKQELVTRALEEAIKWECEQKRIKGWISKNLRRVFGEPKRMTDMKKEIEKIVDGLVNDT